MADPRFQTFRGVYTTTAGQILDINDSQVPFMTMPTNSAASFFLRAIGVDPTGNAVVFNKTVPATRASGTTSLVGTVLDVVAIVRSTALALSTANATVVASGNDTLVRLTGDASAVMKWAVEFTIIQP